MSTTMLYRKGSVNHFWRKFFAESAIFDDADVKDAIDSGEWFAHPGDVPQPGDETQPAAPESHEAAPMVQSHYQPVLPPSEPVQEQKAKTTRKTKKAE